MVGAIAAIVGAAIGQKTLEQRWVPTENWLKEPRLYGRAPQGFVTKKSTALSIGRAAILDRYDEELLRQLEPLDAKRFGDVWVVYSYLPLPKSSKIEDSVVGGVTTVEISSSTGAILNFWRGM